MSHSPESPVGYFTSQLKRMNPQYEFTFFEGNVQRILTQMRQTDNTCFIACLEDRTRLKYLYWTPYSLMPPPVVIMNKDRAEKLKLKGPAVSLKELIQIPGIVGSISMERSYGPQIDDVLAKANGSNFRRSAQDFIAVNVLVMIAKGRVDYTIEHISTLEVHAKLDSKDLSVFTIAEATAELIAYFACSRSEVGKQLITDVDEFVRKNIGTAGYQKILVDPLIPKQRSESYLRTWKAFAKERGKSPQIE
ncbi:hypothetical protein ACLVWU_17725 [Bdellovibrio sp. HCB290]|uniref:hypothetical protein n=1 Tax=Bdellovibrio sp. HCB290 TaxID=3394356 RepID=UPI0039B4883E